MTIPNTFYQLQESLVNIVMDFRRSLLVVDSDLSCKCLCIISRDLQTKQISRPSLHPVLPCNSTAMLQVIFSFSFFFHFHSFLITSKVMTDFLECVVIYPSITHPSFSDIIGHHQLITYFMAFICVKLDQQVYVDPNIIGDCVLKLIKLIITMCDYVHSCFQLNIMSKAQRTLVNDKLDWVHLWWDRKSPRQAIWLLIEFHSRSSWMPLNAKNPLENNQWCWPQDVLSEAVTIVKGHKLELSKFSVDLSAARDSGTEFSFYNLCIWASTAQQTNQPSWDRFNECILYH